MQFDEKWAFVGKKQKNCDPDDARCGDCWDHVALDPEHRLVLGVVFGKRSASKVLTLLRQVKAQLQGRVPRLVSSDEFASYATVLKRVWPDTSRRPRDATHAARDAPVINVKRPSRTRP